MDENTSYYQLWAILASTCVAVRFKIGAHFVNTPLNYLLPHRRSSNSKNWLNFYISAPTFPTWENCLSGETGCKHDC